MTTLVDNPRRADAQRNRRRMLEVAVEVIAERGLDVPITEIVRRAGLGRSTFFRHFPTKDALVVEIVADQFRRLAALAADANGRHRQAGEALRTYLVEGARIYSFYRAFFEAIPVPLPDDPMITEANDRLNAELTRLLARAQAEGDVRDDIVPTDIRLLMVAITTLYPNLRAAYPQAWRRYAELIYDSFRPAAAAESRMDAVAPVPRTWRPWETAEQPSELS